VGLFSDVHQETGRTSFFGKPIMMCGKKITPAPAGTWHRGHDKITCGGCLKAMGRR
jgi:hypothetical protein